MKRTFLALAVITGARGISRSRAGLPGAQHDTGGAARRRRLGGYCRPPAGELNVGGSRSHHDRRECRGCRRHARRGARRQGSPRWLPDPSRHRRHAGAEPDTLQGAALRFDARLRAVGLAVDVPIILQVKNGFPADNLPTLYPTSRANAAKLSFGSPGAGSSNHLACVLFNAAIGVEVTHVPYRAVRRAVPGHDCRAARLLVSDHDRGSAAREQGQNDSHLVA